MACDLTNAGAFTGSPSKGWPSDFPGGLPVKILCFHCRGHMFDPCMPLGMVKKTAESEMCARESPPVGAAFAQKPFRIRRKSEL